MVASAAERDSSNRLVASVRVALFTSVRAVFAVGAEMFVSAVL